MLISHWEHIYSTFLKGQNYFLKFLVYSDLPQNSRRNWCQCFIAKRNCKPCYMCTCIEVILPSILWSIFEVRHVLCFISWYKYTVQLLESIRLLLGEVGLQSNIQGELGVKICSTLAYVKCYNRNTSHYSFTKIFVFKTQYFVLKHHFYRKHIMFNHYICNYIIFNHFICNYIMYNLFICNYIMFNIFICKYIMFNIFICN